MGIRLQGLGTVVKRLGWLLQCSGFWITLGQLKSEMEVWRFIYMANKSNEKQHQALAHVALWLYTVIEITPKLPLEFNYASLGEAFHISQRASRHFTAFSDIINGV